MIDKTRLGIPFFDERYGGIYRKRPALCIGRQGSGKTILALQVLLQSVKENERGLMLSSWRSHDLAIVAENMGFPLAEASSQGLVTLLEYADIMPTPEFEKSLTLPPGSFMELQNIIESNSIRRVVIDTVLPWVAIRQEDKLAKHIYSFIQALERMGVTALLTLPKPVSAMAFSLKNRLEEQIPIVFTLDVDASGRRTLMINKYLGDHNLPPPIPFVFAAGAGIIRAPKIIPISPSSPPTDSPRTPAPSHVPHPPPPEPSAPVHISMSQAFNGPPSAQVPPPNPGTSPETPPKRPPPPAGPIKFSSAFRP